jgi:hypothetical protein
MVLQQVLQQLEKDGVSSAYDVAVAHSLADNNHSQLAAQSSNRRAMHAQVPSTCRSALPLGDGAAIPARHVLDMTRTTTVLAGGSCKSHQLTCAHARSRAATRASAQELEVRQMAAVPAQAQTGAAPSAAVASWAGWLLRGLLVYPARTVVQLVLGDDGEDDVAPPAPPCTRGQVRVRCSGRIVTAMMVAAVRAGAAGKLCQLVAACALLEGAYAIPGRDLGACLKYIGKCSHAIHAVAHVHALSGPTTRCRAVCHTAERIRARLPAFERPHLCLPATAGPGSTAAGALLHAAARYSADPSHVCTCVHHLLASSMAA